MQGPRSSPVVRLPCEPAVERSILQLTGGDPEQCSGKGVGIPMKRPLLVCHTPWLPLKISQWRLLQLSQEKFAPAMVKA